MAKDYGSLVSQKGYDGKTCDDRFLVYSSAFPVLKTYNVYSVTTTIPASGTNTITINHNLGYLAPFIVVYNGNTTIGQTRSYFFCDSLGYSFDWTYLANVNQYANSLTIDIPSVWYDGAVGDTVYFTVYLFLDDFSTLAAKSVNSGTTSGAGSTDYGKRISKPGFDVKTCADVDCILSSSFFTNIVHMKGSHTASADETFTITHNLGYFPISLIYCTRYAVGAGIIHFPTVENKVNTIDIDLFEDEIVYYIILKNKNG